MLSLFTNNSVKETKMKVFVTGVAGQLGHDIMNDLAARGYEGIGTDIASEYNGISDGTAVTRMPYVSLDITDRTAVEQVIGALKPDVVIHCAAWTAVDLAEDDDKKAKVHAINADGTQNIADACKKIDAKMVYISTDYVFDGQGTTPWQPDCKDYAPLNVYGQTKLDGELAVANTLEKYFIVRIAWVFGVNGKNFIKTMLNAGKTHDKLTVVSDQIGTPTYTLDLSRLLVDMIETDKYGYYHATNEGGYISWYDFTKEIFKLAVEHEEMEKFAKVLEDFVRYLQEKPFSRKESYLAKEKHDTICCYRCGYIYKGVGVCPRCGYKQNE